MMENICQEKGAKWNSWVNVKNTVLGIELQWLIGKFGFSALLMEEKFCKFRNSWYKYENIKLAFFNFKY